MSDLPFAYDLDGSTGLPSHFDAHTIRKLSSMKGQFNDANAYARLLAEEDTVLYEVYELSRPHLTGELLSGISVIHAGTVGDEFFMTKGHFHAVLETAEVYYVLRGQGFMVMENPEGDGRVEEYHPGRVVYVPPRWAHRSVNTGMADLVFFWVYPGHAGHDYGTIERRGFGKLVVRTPDGVKIIDNPRWAAPGARSQG
ncbi:MAG TPA: glucose-6-phosphate isomerase family protein [Anaerolineaceae bacterium]|jgi:glucose-6-phosphate isomerase, archaeal